jgi:hypothetical protein
MTDELKELAEQETQNPEEMIAPAAVEVAFPKMVDARHQAVQQFRKGVLQLLNQSITGGINKAIVEVSMVSDMIVDETSEELKLLGYDVSFRNIVKNNAGYTSKNMVISYDWKTK